MSSQKILVVDDEALVADLSRMALGDIGYDVYCAYSGEQAADISSKKHFDLAIVDGMLPGMSGIETFDVIRQNNPDIMGLLITGHPDIDMVIEAMNKGFCGVLEKPFDIDELVRNVREALNLAKIREENTRFKTLLPLYNLGEIFFSAGSKEEIYEELIEAVLLQTPVPVISLMVHDVKDSCLKIVASRGLDSGLVEKIRVKPGKQIAGWVYEKGTPVILNRGTQNKSLFAPLLSRNNIQASISYPLVGREKNLGVLNLSQTKENVEYSKADLEMLSIICSQAVMALENVEMIRHREKNIRMQALLEQYVAPEVAELLLDSDQNLMDVGSVQTITVLFADIRNFTFLVQHLPPEDLRDFLNHFFDLFSESVFSWQGTMDKFMGDGGLVIFGAPVAIKTPSIAAVSAAIEIVNNFEILRLQWLEKSHFFKEIGLGIGVSRGEMFVGNVGSAKRLDYTVVGTDVNISQRLATDTDAGQILITESVRQDVRDHFLLKTEDPRILKGIEKEMALYSVKT